MSRVRVLAVDDQSRSLRLLQSLLEGKGFEVRVAATAAEALDLLPVFKPRVLVVAVPRPDPEGYAFVRRLREDGMTGSLPVLAVAPAGGADEEARARAAGCDACVARPLDARGFPDLVERLARGPGGTVLVVEDESTVLGLVRALLEGEGYEVLAVEDPLLAAKAATDHGRPVHVLLTDLAMPRMRGPKVIEEVRRVVPGIPAILMSGYEAAELSPRDAGEFSYLKKPFTGSELLTAVRRALGTRSG